MRNSTADYLFILFIYCQAYPIVTNADLILTRKSTHLLKVSEIERIFAYERFEDDLSSLSLDILRKFGTLFHKAFFYIQLSTFRFKFA